MCGEIARTRGRTEEIAWRGDVNREHEAHLDRIVARAALAVEQKYRRGQVQHGGELWRKAGMLTHAEQETWDFVVYVCTLREQLEALLAEMRAEELGYCNCQVFADELARIIGPAQE